VIFKHILYSIFVYLYTITFIVFYEIQQKYTNASHL